jgi:hypothetical protein
MRSSRLFARTALFIACAVLVLLLVDTAGWFWLTGRMEADVAAWKAARVAEGYVVGGLPSVRGGWPLRAEVIVPDLSLATSEAPVPASASWQVDRVVLHYSLLHPAALLIRLQGGEHVRFGATAPVDVTAKKLDILVTLSHAGEAVATVEGQAVSVPFPAGPLELGTVSARFDGMSGMLQAASVALPGVSLPFGGVIDSIALSGRTSVPLPPGRDLAQMAAAWRGAGGQLTFDHAALRWGSLDAEGSAVLALDEALQPRGNATLQLTGFTETIEALTRAGVLARNDARVAGTVLSLMSRSRSDGVAEATVPLTLDSGRVSMGAIPLARLPAVAWQ